MNQEGVVAQPAIGFKVSMQKKHWFIRNQLIVSLVLFGSGFLSVQRFTLSPLNTFICLIPLALFIVQLFRGHHQTAVTYLVLALFFSISYGGSAYAETIASLRYFIYLSAIVMLFWFSTWRIQWKRLFLGALLGFGVIYGSIATAFGIVPIDMSTLQRDLMVIAILFAFLIGRSSMKLDLRLMYIGSLGYLFGEVVNGLFFFRTHAGEYLNYDGLKVFVIFPLIYALSMRKNIIFEVALAIATLYVISMYGTRMITLSLMMLSCLGLIIGLFRSGSLKYLFFFFFFIAFFILINTEFVMGSDFGGFKAIAFFATFLENFEASELLERLALLDPIRFMEYQLFFERPILEIILGSGVGSGLYDTNGLLEFVGLDWTAFSAQELISATFYNFHDYWVDFGLRFGLVFVIYLFFILALLPMFRGQILQGIMFGLVLLNATFATEGIIFLALLAWLWPLQSKEKASQLSYRRRGLT